ncbi:MAG: hypothetical protein FWE34_03380 [Defluviitaleaceae bacterium]|nr:hypothetical protein [Defluviitaleaceae bacterium]
MRQKLTKKDLKTIDEMIGFVRDENILYVSKLWEYAEKKRPDDWFVSLRNRNGYRCMKAYINSRRYSKYGNVGRPRKMLHEEN